MFIRWGGLASLVLLVCSSLAQAGIGISFGFCGPVGVHFRSGPFCHRPYPYPYAIYRPYAPYYVVPPPVYYYEPVPVPVYVEAARVATPPPPSTDYTPPAPAAPAVPAVPAAPSLPAPRSPENLPPPLEPVPAQPIARAGHATTTPVPDLPTALANARHPDERLRQDAIATLSRSPSPGAVDALNHLVTRDPIPAVREAAARALGSLGRPGGLAALKTAASGDPDAEVRRSAAAAIERIQAALRGW